MPRVTNRSWTEAEIARLRDFSKKGATINRAAAALNRKTDAVRKQCRALGLTLVGTRQAKAAIRALDDLTSPC